MQRDLMVAVGETMKNRSGLAECNNSIYRLSSIRVDKRR